jgi:hypothetical protein
VSTYIALGSRGPVTGVADTTGNNPGNWTATFDQSTIDCNMPYFEVCHIVVNGAPNSAFTVYVGTRQWDTFQLGQSNSWDPTVPIPLNPGQILFFYYNDPTTDNHPPIITIWLRYDQDIVANQKAVFGQQAQGGSS